jgi:alcohol dehydrogenase class IV
VRFELATAGSIIFGDGVAERLPELAKSLGARALLVTGSDANRSRPLQELVRAAGVTLTRFAVAREPTIDIARDAVAAARREGCDFVIALGGGSVIDLGKAAAALLANGGDPLDYLEVIGAGRKLARPSLSCIAVPTTAGTGSEVTRNAVLASPEQRVKASLRSSGMLPRIALVDPRLTYAMPPAVTASTGLDALTQLIEPFVSSRANPLTDGFCREGLSRAASALPRAYADGRDAEAREAMALASLLGGLALANAGLGAAHGLAAPLGGLFDAPHGALCARLLPFVMDMNVRALRERAPASDALPRFDEVARLLTGKPRARAEDGVAWVIDLCAKLAVLPLASFGLSAADVPAVAAKAAVASSMQANPVKLTEDELQLILSRAL